MDSDHKNVYLSIPLKTRRRLFLLALGIFSLHSILLIQFYKIQIMEGVKWQRFADNQHFVQVTEPFKRGTFFANTRVKPGHPSNPQPLVIDLQKFHLYADPAVIPEAFRQEISLKLEALIGARQLPSSKVLVELSRRSRSRKLIMWLDQDLRGKILDWWLPFAKDHQIARNALYFIKDYQRTHPFGKLLGPVLHTIQEVKEADTKQALPTGGLELALNSYLKGQQGKRRMMRSPRNALATEEIIQEPQDGADIYLTINPILQAICETEVASAVREAEARAAWAVMMDPQTGELLAMAQYPFFHPDHYQDYFNDPDQVGKTKVKAITDAFEPGSTMKPLNLALALEANKDLQARGQPPFFSPQEKVDTVNGRFAGRSKPVQDVRQYQSLNMYMALQKSSNVYLARVVQRLLAAMGPDWYVKGLAGAFGLGERLGIQLPAESPGLLPHPGSPQWSQGTPISMAFGYNLQVTSLQMVRAYAILANGGYSVEPTLVQRIVEKTEEGSETVLWDSLAQPLKKKVLSKESVQEVVKGLKYATKTGGAAFRADIPGYTQAGKTGTTKKLEGGQYSSDKYFATFVGFAPADNPRLVLLVAIDEPRVFRRPESGMNYYGGVCAAPVFREIAHRSLEYLGVAPDDPNGYRPGDPRSNREMADWEPERRELQALFEEWNR